jgi:adenylate cyclase class IV
MSKYIQIEFRWLLSEDEYNQLMESCMKDAQTLSKENKNVHFVILSDKFLRISHDLDTWEGEIVLKLNKIWIWSDFEVKKLSIKPNDISTFIDILNHLWHTQIQEWCLQTSHNFIYDDVLVKLKHSNDWWYHAQLEVTIDNAGSRSEAVYLIRKLANKLWLSLLTTEELKRVTDQIDKKHISKQNNLIHKDKLIF